MQMRMHDEIEHQTWLKDMDDWEKEHQVVREAINSLMKKLRTYDVVLDYHRHQIVDHHELIALHDDAMNWHAENNGNPRRHEMSDLLELADEAHSAEARMHVKLRDLHLDILKGSLEFIGRLGTVL